LCGVSSFASSLSCARGEGAGDATIGIGGRGFATGVTSSFLPVVSGRSSVAWLCSRGDSVRGDGLGAGDGSRGAEGVPPADDGALDGVWGTDVGTARDGSGCGAGRGNSGAALRGVSVAPGDGVAGWSSEADFSGFGA
jgi:hypothetical protein